MSEMHKELTQLNIKNKIQSKNGQKTLTDVSPKKTSRQQTKM